MNKINLRHIIGRAALAFYQFIYTLPVVSQTLDATVPDYAFYDKLRRGFQPGYELLGHQSQTISEIITSWVIGRGVSVELATVEDKRFQNKVTYTNNKLQKFMISLQSYFNTLHEDLLALGDQYVIVNPDGSILSIPPNQVKVKIDPENYNYPLEYKIRSQFGGIIIEEVYNKDERIITITNGKKEPIIKRFTNLFGEIPIVHFANDKATNEFFGRPLVESLIRNLSRADDLTNKSIQGAKIAGNPVPAFENLEDPEATIELNSVADEETYIDKDGTEVDRKVLKWDNETALILGLGGKFEFKSPVVGFSTDIIGVLKMLKEHFMDKTHSPKQLWGSDDTQVKEKDLTPFIRFIEGRRDKFAGTLEDEELGIEATDGLYRLIMLWLKARSFVDNKIYVGPVIIHWSDLTEGDKKLTFEWAKFLFSRQKITGKTLLRLSDLVEDVDKEIELAELEASLNNSPQQFDDFGGTGNPVSNDGTPDLRTGNGADAPRSPSFAGGGQNN